MNDIPTRDGKPVEDPARSGPSDHDRSADWNARQYVPNRVLSWRAVPDARKIRGPVWIGLGLVLCGLVLLLVFGLGYAFVDSASQTLKEFLRENLAVVLVALAFLVFGAATAAAGLVNRGRR